MKTHRGKWQVSVFDPKGLRHITFTTYSKAYNVTRKEHERGFPVRMRLTPREGEVTQPVLFLTRIEGLNK